jgi:cellobiose-specific phosphotransferase system component IIA
MNKELQAIEQELKGILEAGQQKEAEYEAETKAARENEEEANRAVIQAKKGDDPKAYAKAIEEKRMAQNIAQYYEGKIEQIKDEPFITEAEYRDYTKRIKAEMDAINNEGKAKASKLFEELEAIKEEVAPAYAKANDLLRKLQNNIYKSTYEKQMADAKEKGTPINTDRLHNEYKDYSLISGIDYILKSQAAKTIKEGGSK